MKSSGPIPAKIAIVGEAPGKEEAAIGLPFMGHSGQELTRMLKEADIVRRECFMTNVVFERPLGNKFEEFCIPKAELPSGYSLPPLGSGKYLHPRFLPDLERLKEELTQVQPNLIIALGGTASWALMNSPKITAVRGVVATSTMLPGTKVLPTYHPAAVLRQWAYRPIVVADLIKASYEAQFPEVRRPERTVWIDPELWEVLEWTERLSAEPLLSIDIETNRGLITCIGFSPNPGEGFVIPFSDPRSSSGSYWANHEQEKTAWLAVQQILESPAVKLFQNGLYDLQYILRMGLRIKNVWEDTMILHHAKYPEMQKSLGFMGSIYTNESSWKLLRIAGKDSNKREEV